MAGDMILVVDFGGYQARTMARMLRSDSVYCEIARPREALRTLNRSQCKGVLLAGEAADEALVDAGILAANRPVLAMGGAARGLCRALGGDDLGLQEEKKTALLSFADLPLFRGLVESDRYLNRVDLLELPQGVKPAAFAEGGMTPAFAMEERKIYGLQFYAEVNDPDGLRILHNFAYDVCGCEPWWRLDSFAEEAQKRVREAVGNGTALISISGGVDSAVCAVLAHRAVGAQLKCVYVNTGLMRLGETELVKQMFQSLGMELICVDATERFLQRLKGVADADEKRDAVADEMLHVVADKAAEIGEVDCLIQGTIYPDVLSERSSDNGAANDRRTLKDHIRFRRLLEPLRVLFKDEVRALGRVLDMPEELIHRQPFPEAGLAVRCLGEVTREKLAILSRADAIFREEVADAGLDKRIWQYFAVLTDVKTRGIRDGVPASEYALALRAVSSKDAISANYYRLPYDLIERVVERVTAEVPGVGRVLYDVTGKPPAMIEWE